jgi:hypothetical protein
MVNYIHPRSDFDGSDAAYQTYLLGQRRWAEQVLSAPAAQWPRGDSHAIAREVLAHVADALIEVACDNACLALGGDGKWTISTHNGVLPIL